MHPSEGELLVQQGRGTEFAFSTRRPRSTYRRSGCSRPDFLAVFFEQHWNQRSLGFFHKREFSVLMTVDAYKVTQLQLAGCTQIRQREDHIFLNGALQMSSAVLIVGSFLEQELFHLGRAAEDELSVSGGLKNPLLNHSQLDLKDLFKVLRLERLEDDNLVDAVHEFRRELSARRFGGRARDLIVELGVNLVGLLTETQSAGDELTHLSSAEARRHHDHAL